MLFYSYWTLWFCCLKCMSTIVCDITVQFSLFLFMRLNIVIDKICDSLIVILSFIIKSWKWNEGTRSKRRFKNKYGFIKFSVSIFFAVVFFLLDLESDFACGLLYCSQFIPSWNLGSLLSLRLQFFWSGFSPCAGLQMIT